MPRPIEEVLSAEYIAFFLASVAFIYLFFLVDRVLYQHGFLDKLTDRLVISAPTSLTILRVASFLFFISLFGYGWVNKSFFLTPDLYTDNPLIKWLHLTIAVAALHRPASPIIGVCLLILWAMAVHQYGIIHALDYIVFLGLAAFFIASGMRDCDMRTAGSVAMFALLGINFGWLAIEKWAYPQWTYAMLEKRPELLFGIPPDTYMIFAGFVEFNVAFVLLGAVSSFSRVVALGLGAIFVLAISQFGLIDAVGHLFIIAILLILVLRGPTRARHFMVLSDKSVWAHAYFMTGLYFLAFVMIFLAYYGLRHLYYGV
ncbi:MAG: hypothetical protein ABFS23_01440 [Pseudomonadota bacterium]